MKRRFASIDVDSAVRRLFDHVEEANKVLHFQLFWIAVKRAEDTPIGAQAVDLDLDDR